MQQAREKDFGGNLGTKALANPVLALCLSSRRNLCIHPKVSREDDREKVDSMCRERTAQWVKPNRPPESETAAAADSSKKPARALKKGKTQDIEDIGRCTYYDNFEERADTFNFPKGIYTLDDLKKLGVEHGMCPYFLARRFLINANVIVYNYAYLLDPKIANLVSSEL